MGSMFTIAASGSSTCYSLLLAAATPWEVYVVGSLLPRVLLVDRGSVRLRWTAAAQKPQCLSLAESLMMGSSNRTCIGFSIGFQVSTRSA